MQAVCFLLGVPEADRHRLFACVEHIFDHTDESDFLALSPERVAAATELHEYGVALIAEKRARTADDMLSVVVGATLDDVSPPRLTDDELSAFFSLLFSAGAETTRNAIAGGLLALLDRPDLLARFRPGLPPAAVEEILRWTTPSPSKRRTATRPVTLGGCAVAPGDKVVVWEGSANRDSARFPDPGRFDPDRDPNPHLTFGHGAHFCLGAHLARLELRVVLDQVLATFSSLSRAGGVEWTRSNRHTGYRHVPLDLRRA
jgi:cytochrome P450